MTSKAGDFDLLGGLHEYLHCLNVMVSGLKPCQFSCVLQYVKCPEPLLLSHLVMRIRLNKGFRPFCELLGHLLF